MAAPVISFKDENDNDLSGVNWAYITQGSVSNAETIRIYNNFDNNMNIADAENTFIRIASANDLLSGDTNANGQEVISENLVEIKCIEYGDIDYFSVGANKTKAIGYTKNTDSLLAKSGSNVCNVLARIYLPYNLSSTGNVNFKIRVGYNYS